MDEFHAHPAGAPGARPVLLTFDDARRSFWENAFPVLQEADARSALFVPSFWMRARKAVDERSSIGLDDARWGFMTWTQIRECDRSEVVDVESHGHRHALVATTDRVVAFSTPQTVAHHDLFDWPLRRERDGDVAGPPELGTPVYESQPMLSTTARLLDAPSVTEACRQMVAARGGASFFSRRDASRRLHAAHAAALASAGGLRPMSHEELLSQVQVELEQAVRSFERELGRKPRYFAYPWMLGTTRSLAMLAELGVEAAFGVAIDYRRARATRQPLPTYGRYKSDWLQFLPGKGRRRLRDVLPQKVATFTASQHLAH